MNGMDLYKKMFLVRTLEAKFLELAKETGELSDLHLNKGQEAISIGVTSVLRPTDYIATHHRTISHAIGKGIPLQPLVDEIMGRATGINGGNANEMHINDPKIGYLFSFQLVGTAVPVAAGIAWASRYVKKEDNVVALFIGDAATGNAQFFEGMNAAAIRKVPLLVVIENNHLAGNITPDYYFPDNAGLKERFAAFGVETESIDGNKIDEVVNVAKLAVKKVREESRPFGLICDTTRLLMHKLGQGDIRTPEHIAELAQRDPIIYMEQMLNFLNIEKMAVKEEAIKIVNEAIDKAHAAPWPLPDKVLLDNYNS